MAWNVHTEVTANTYEINGKAPAPIFDPETHVATLEADLVFNGSRSQVEAFFAFGKANSPNGGAGMFSLTPASIEMVPYTDDDPHWDVRGRWIGLHGDVHSGADLAYNYTVEWLPRTVDYPIETPTGGATGGTTYVEPPPKGFAPTGNNPFTSAPYKARRKDWVPVVHVLAVMRSTTPPSPFHAKVIQILNAIPANALDDRTGNYTNLRDPVWVSWERFDAPLSISANANSWPQKVAWFPVIHPLRRIPGINGTHLHIFTIDATLEQQVQPG